MSVGLQGKLLGVLGISPRALSYYLAKHSAIDQKGALV